MHLIRHECIGCGTDNRVMSTICSINLISKEKKKILIGIYCFQIVPKSDASNITNHISIKQTNICFYYGKSKTLLPPVSVLLTGMTFNTGDSDKAELTTF